MTDSETSLREALLRMRTVFGMIMDELDADPSETVVQIKVAGPEGIRRTVAVITVQQVFDETDALIGPPPC